MTTITTKDGTNIFFKDWGPKDGQPIVFSHGWPLSADAWDAQMVFFANKGFRTIAHDRRSRMACEVLRTEPGVSFLVAGDWLARGTPEQKNVERLLDESGFRDRIRFLGEVRGSDKAALLVRTDIYVLPTYYPFEGQPNAIIEAMAAGCAVVSTDYAAIPETVADGETGIIVPTRDVPALTAAVTRLCRDRGVLWGMAKASYARYREGYTGEQSSDRVGASILRAIAPADVH